MKKDEGQAAQATQRQTRPPNPHNKKPDCPTQTNKTKKKSLKNSKTNIKQKSSNNSKNAWQAGGYDLPGPPIEVSTSHDANTRLFFIYAPPLYYYLTIATSYRSPGLLRCPRKRMPVFVTSSRTASS